MAVTLVVIWHNYELSATQLKSTVIRADSKSIGPGTDGRAGENWSRMPLLYLFIALGFGVAAYRDVKKFEAKHGKGPWGGSPPMWGIVVFFFGLLGILLLFLAERNTKKQLQMNAPWSQPHFGAPVGYGAPPGQWSPPPAPPAPGDWSAPPPGQSAAPSAGQWWTPPPAPGQWAPPAAPAPQWGPPAAPPGPPPEQRGDR
jgi:hypothetical protein